MKTTKPNAFTDRAIVVALPLLWFMLSTTAHGATPPVITSQPTSQTVQIGSNATFMVQASSSTALGYQWYFQSNAIAGATGSSYTRTNVQPAHSGAYYVSVSNADGTVKSANATLWVVTHPVISFNSSSSAATTGSAASLTWPHSISNGNNRILIVGLSLTTGQATNVTYGGAPLTLIGRRSGIHTVELWRLLEPAVGTANIVASFNGSRQVVGGASAFNEVNQSKPTDDFHGAGSENGNVASVSVPSAVGELVIDTLFVDLVTTATPGADQTQRWSRTNGRLGAGSTEPGSSQVVMSWNLGTSDEWDLGAVSLKPVLAPDVITTVSGPANVFATTNFTYTVAVTNLGSLAATNIVVTDTLPAGVAFVGASGGGTLVGGGPGQVVFDSASSNAVSGTTSWTHVTTSAANRLLLVGVTLGNYNQANDVAVTALTYGGLSLDKLLVVTNGIISSEVWQLVNPPSGTNTITVTRSGNSSTLVAGAATFSGVDQATPVRTVSSAFGPRTFGSSLTIASATNEIVFDNIAVDKFFPPGAGAGQTQLWSIGPNYEAGGGSIKPGTNSVKMVWSLQNNGWADAAASVKPAGLAGTVSWTIPTLAAGASTNLTITVTAPLGGTLTNTVASTASSTDVNPANNDGSAANARVVTTVTRVADLVTTQTGPSSVAPLTEFTYTVRVSNQGPSTATNVTVTDTLAPALTYVRSSGGGSYLGGVVTWPEIASLASGATANYTVTVRSPVSGTLTNSAASTFAGFDPNPANSDGSAPASQVVTVVSPLQVANTSRGASVQTLNWNHTISPGSSRILVVGVSVDSTNAAIIAASFAGFLPLTPIGQTNGTQTRVAMYYLLNPPVGTYPISINLDASTGIVGGAVSFNGVNQSNPVAGIVANVGSGTNANLSLTSSAGSVVVDTVAPKSPRSVANATSAQTLQWNLFASNYSGAGSTMPGATIASPGYNLDEPADWTMAAVALTPSTTLSDITLTAAGPATVLASSNLTYSITVTNLGSSTATKLVVSDVLPAGTSFVSASSGGTYSAGVVSWPTVNTFPVGAVTNYTLTVRAPISGSLTNIAYSTSSTADPDPANNNGAGSANQVVTTVTPQADVTTTVNGPASVLAGSDFSYTVTVTNAGPSSASDVLVSNPLPAGTAFVSVSGNGTNNNGVVTWLLPDFAGGAATNLTVVVTAPVDGTLTNVVASTAATADPVSANNNGSQPAAQLITTVTPVADLVTTLTGPASVLTNANFSYAITLTNSGPSPATSITVSDPLPPGTSFVSATGGGTFTAGTVTWSLTSLAAGTATNFVLTVIAPVSGSLTNIVSGSSPTLDPNTANNDGSAAAARVVTGVYPFLLLSRQQFQPGGFQFEFQTHPDSLVTILASTNLIDWIELITTNSGDGRVIFMDTDPQFFHWRFYRSRQ
ncbi:MAG TPA: hypothetical protein DCY13_15345 [Verrucomicrobiales bacterium]|nr:hypothetical protein [Verrucomicrobiales bacterium]